MQNPNHNYPRWRYRFDNFRRAFTLLNEAFAIGQKRGLSQLEKEGIIQRFEYSWELAWKVLKDYLEFTGIVLETVTPAAVIKAAFAAKLIENADIWMQALDARNKMSHTYDFIIFEQIINDIEQYYLGALEGMYLKMIEIDLNDISHD